MAQYSGLERKVARILESQPWLRDLIRHSYKRLIFLVNRPKQLIALNQDIHLVDMAEKCQIKEYDAFFFGYYDKSPWSPDGTYYLAHLLVDKVCKIVRCQPGNNSHKILAETTAWNYQQGAMVQWLNAEGEIIYNDYKDKVLGAIRLNPLSGTSQFIPFPVQVVHPTKKEYLSLNYRRLAKQRPDYGYFEDCINFQIDQPYAEDGIWKVNYETGEAKLLVTIQELADKAPPEFKQAAHKVNHCYYSPDGSHFVFLHRWMDASGKYSRLICGDADGNAFRNILDYRMISHYSWINNTQLVVWARTPEFGDAYIILNAMDGTYQAMDHGDLTRFGDGHPTVNHDGNQLITDTYPDKGRLRTLLLFDRESKGTTPLGTFFAPWKFDGEKRCDLHPRWHPFESTISIDSAHEGKRKNYLLELNG